MAATPQSVDKVADLISRMQALIAYRTQVRFSIGDNPDVVLTAQQIADIKAAMLSKYQAMHDAVKAEVSGW